MSKVKGFIEILIPVLIAMAAIGVTVGYKYWATAADDNPVEEIAEEIIKKETGIDVDLSPTTPEK